MPASLRASSDSPETVLAALASGEFALGYQRYESLSTPSPTDDLWAAQCLVQLGRRAEALAMFSRLRAAGLEDAAPLAAVAYRFEGNLEAAREALMDLDTWRLTGFGEAVAWRERGMLAYTAGRLQDALTCTRRAWRAALADDTARLFLPSFTAPLAMILAALGHDHAASQYITQALPGTSEAQRAPLLWILSACQVRAGQFSAAHDALNQIATCTLTPPSRSLLAYHWGVYHQTLGAWAEAAEAFTQAARLARETGLVEAEGYASLQLAALACRRGQTEIGSVYLARAQSRIIGARAQALCAAQEGALLAFSPEGTGQADALICAAANLRALGLQREAGETQVLIAEVHLRRGEEDLALQALLRAAESRATLGDNVTIAARILECRRVHDWVTHSPVRDVSSGLSELQQDLRRLTTSRPAPLVLTTLGRYGLHLGDTPIKLNVGLRRTLELLTYLLQRGEVTLENLQTDVFEGCTPHAARDYLHVIRHALSRSIPGLHLPFDRTRGVYQLKVYGRELHWDVQQLQVELRCLTPAGLHGALRAYAGPFLPQCTSGWVEDVRTQLDWLILQSGERVAQQLMNGGACRQAADVLRDLIHRYPEIATLHESLVQAVRADQGEASAALEAERCRAILNRALDLHIPLDQDLK